MRRRAALLAVLVAGPACALPCFAQTGAGTDLLLPAVTLEECVTTAQANSPNLRLAGTILDAAVAALVQARALNGLTMGESVDYFHQGQLPGMSSVPTVNSSAAEAASGGGANGENVQGGLALTGPATSVGLTAGQGMGDGASSDQVSSLILSARQTIFDGYPGGRAAGAVKEAETIYQVSEVSYGAAVKSASYLVKQAYYTLLGDQNTVLESQAIVGQALENQTLYQGLFAAQRATKLDILQVEVALTQARLDVRTAQNTVAIDRKKLSQVIGWPREKQYSLVDSPLPDLPSLKTEDALESALRNRSELLTLDQYLDAAGVALALQKSLALPVVSLTASLGVGQDWAAKDTEGTFTAGVSVALPPLFDGGSQNAQLKQVEDLIAEYRIQRDQQAQSIMTDVENALFGVTDMQDRQALAVLNLKQAQGQYDLEKAKLAVGTGTTLEVLTAFAVLATARMGREQAKSNYLLAVLNLYNVMGL